MAARNAKTPKEDELMDQEQTLNQEEQEVDMDMDLNARIAELAYFKAAQRGFEPGHELDDWCQAEQEINISLR